MTEKKIDKLKSDNIKNSEAQQGAKLSARKKTSNGSAEAESKGKAAVNLGGTEKTAAVRKSQGTKKATVTRKTSGSAPAPKEPVPPERENEEIKIAMTGPAPLTVDAALEIADSEDDAALKKLHLEIPEEPEAVRSFDTGPSVAESSKAKYAAGLEPPAHKPLKADFGFTYPVKADCGGQQTSGEQNKEETLPDAARADTSAVAADFERLKETQPDLAAAVETAEGQRYLRLYRKDRKRKRILALLVLFILVAFVLTFGLSAVFQNLKGFTVNLSGADYEKGLTLYDNASMENGTSKLSVSNIPEFDNVTFGDIRDEILYGADLGDGLHSKADTYFAYSFYVVNRGKGTIDYDISVDIVSAGKGVDDAVRVLVVSDTTVYGAPGNKRDYEIRAKPVVDEKGAWVLDGEGNPVMDKLYDSEHNPLPVQDNALPFENPSTAYLKKTANLGHEARKNIHKYTVVIYLEGGDPDCVDRIKGGQITFRVSLKVTDYVPDLV